MFSMNVQKRNRKCNWNAKSFANREFWKISSIMLNVILHFISMFNFCRYELGIWEIIFELFATWFIISNIFFIFPWIQQLHMKNRLVFENIIIALMQKVSNLDCLPLKMHLHNYFRPKWVLVYLHDILIPVYENLILSFMNSDSRIKW